MPLSLRGAVPALLLFNPQKSSNPGICHPFTDVRVWLGRFQPLCPQLCKIALQELSLAHAVNSETNATLWSQKSIDFSEAIYSGAYPWRDI
jgi:hypothetical protein